MRWETAVTVLGLVAVTVALAGCLGGDGEAGETAGPASVNETNENQSEQVSAWMGADRIRVLQAEKGGPPAFAADVACAAGGGPRLDRAGPVPVGTGSLEMELSVEPGTTGLELGYAYRIGEAADDNEEYEWLNWTDPVFQGNQTFTVDVSPDAVEDAESEGRWVFYYRVNPGVDEACFTGASLNAWSITVDAVRG